MLRLFLLLAWWLAIGFNAVRTRAHAQAQDQPSVLLSLLVLASVFASTATIAVLLQQMQNLASVELLANLALSMFASALSWLLTQTIFAFCYAHLYHFEELHGHAKGADLELLGRPPRDFVLRPCGGLDCASVGFGG